MSHSLKNRLHVGRASAWTRILLLVFAQALGGCRDPNLGAPPCDPDFVKGELVINELVADNEGVAIDELGATEDYVELKNNGERVLRLQEFSFVEGGELHPLPERELSPGEHLLLFADDEPEQGPRHLPFRLSSQGEDLALSTCDSSFEVVPLVALAPNAAFARHPDGNGAFEICRYATPGSDNGTECVPPEPTGLEVKETFSEYPWESPVPPLPSPVVLSELALRPASYIELYNSSAEEVDLGSLTVTISPIAPGEPLPEMDAGTAIELPQTSLAPGKYESFAVSEEDLAQLSEDPNFEGVVSVFNEAGEAIDRIDFMHYPDDSVLARPMWSPEISVFCKESTPDADNECTMLEDRPIGDRVRALRTHGDFAVLAEGGTELATQSVKIVVDVVQGGATHLLGARAWPLHYTFVREVVEGKPPLDRCDPEQNAEFNQGWYDFSVTEYFATTGRRYFLGTLVRHGSTGHQTVEFTPGDEILGQDMRDQFFVMAQSTADPQEWLLRPQDDEQVSKVLPFEGQVPLLAVNGPFADLVYQPLTRGEGFGVLSFVPADELETTPLGVQTILVTDDVPNDIPLTGGLITEAFQTPLAHVNVLSQNRGTPNMALRDATQDPRISAYLGKMVHLVVEGDDFIIEDADPQEAQEFWEARLPDGERQIPRLDIEVRDFVDLERASLESIPQIGAKAAQLAELYRLGSAAPVLCDAAPEFAPPERAFAIPVVHFLEHFEASGARELLGKLSAEAAFAADPLERAAGLLKVRELIVEQPVEESLLSKLVFEVKERFGNERVRLRSSSNAEDLPGFNGAGLYQSASAQIGDDERPIEDALRQVWASLYSSRAYDERQLALIDHNAVSMGVLVHPAYPYERANGVGVSRNVLDPIRGDMYYLNVQAGEASVTNPAPGVLTEELTFQWPPRTPRLAYQGYSSLAHGLVLDGAEVDGVACALWRIHEHFRPLIDPESEDPWFAMEIEFKLHGPERNLIVKQARPHTFSGYELVRDCREF